MQFEFKVQTRKSLLPGTLYLPNDPEGVVLLIHGGGSSRHSPRSQFIAAHLNRARLATLLFDLLTSEEEILDLETGQYRFDIGFLAARVEAATYAIRDNSMTLDLPTGYLGAGTGAAAALLAAARHPTWVDVIVSRGGRPDLAGHALAVVRAPTLLLVGAADSDVLDLNRSAFHKLNCEKSLKIVPDATHLFEEHGALERVAELAESWLTDHFAATRRAGAPIS